MKLRNLILLIFLILSGKLLAKDVKVMDGAGKPVASVVISWPSSSHTSPSSEPVIVDQVNRAFVPHISVITAGQSVDFPNSDNIRHHVYSFSESNPFEIKLYRNRPVEPILFANSGIVALGCNIHDQMIGYIYVAAPNETAVLTDENGIATVPEIESVQYWHPRMSLAGTQVNSVQLSDENPMTIVLDLLPAPEEEKSATFGSATFGSN